MFPIEYLRLDQRFDYRSGKSLTQGVSIVAKIGMVDKTFTANFQLGSQFTQIRLHYLAVCMHKRVETEYEID